MVKPILYRQLQIAPPDMRVSSLVHKSDGEPHSNLDIRRGSVVQLCTEGSFIVRALACDVRSGCIDFPMVRLGGFRIVGQKWWPGPGDIRQRRTHQNDAYQNPQAQWTPARMRHALCRVPGWP